MSLRKSDCWFCQKHCQQEDFGSGFGTNSGFCAIFTARINSLAVFLAEGPYKDAANGRINSFTAFAKPSEAQSVVT